MDTPLTILAPKKIDNLNIKTKMLDFEHTF